MSAPVQTPTEPEISHAAARLTRGQREMLERIDGATKRNGSLMLLTVTAAGRGEVTKIKRLIAADLVELCDHQLPRGPVDGVRITDAGRIALAEGRAQ